VLTSKVKKTVNNDVHIHVTPAFARRNNLHVFFEKVRLTCTVSRSAAYCPLRTRSTPKNIHTPKN
jgi:hypothetical protein